MHAHGLYWMYMYMYMDVTYMYCKTVSHTGSQAGWGPVEVFWCPTASDTARYMYIHVYIAYITQYIAYSFDANLQITTCTLWPSFYVTTHNTCNPILVPFQRGIYIEWECPCVSCVPAQWHGGQEEERWRVHAELSRLPRVQGRSVLPTLCGQCSASHLSL